MLALFGTLFRVAMAQTNVPLKFSQDLPKNLYSVPTAVLITYTTNSEITEAEETQKISEISTQLLTDNQQMGLQLLHFANKNAILNPSAKQRLLKQYDSLKIENLLFLEVNEISGMGTQSSYVFKLTPFNKTSKMMSNNQRAFILQAETYGMLIRDFKASANEYAANYFIKGPARTPSKPNLATEPDLYQTPAKTSPRQPPAPLTYPAIKLTAADENRYFGGPVVNFYYYLGANQQEKNAGFFGQHLRKDISYSPEALVQLNKYRNYKIAYLAERTVFVTTIILYAGQVLSGDNFTYFNDKQKVLIGVAAGSLLVNVLLARKTNEKMRRAIGEYNGFATLQNNSGYYKFKPDNWSFGTVYDRKMIPGLTLQWNLR